MVSSRWLRAVFAAITAFAFGLGLAAFSPASAQAATPTTWTVTVGSESPNHMIQGMNYGPSDIYINVGDAVHWVADSMEPHTVSFIDDAHPMAPFSPAIGYMVERTPEEAISAPGEFRSSGIIGTMSDDILPPARGSYDLTFAGVGDYTYYCYIHGTAMKANVHVRAAGTPYPHTQQWYNVQTSKARAAVIRDGQHLWTGMRTAADAHHVYVGASDMTAMVMAFTRSHTTIRVGESVTFDLSKNSPDTPHTVTFLPEPKSPFFVPVGDPAHYAGGTLNSGVLTSASGPYTVTFTEAGTYDYVCMLHDTMGMVGSVTVLP